MITAFLMVFGGFIMLAAGGEVLVKGAVALAGKLQVPPLIIGLTLVALGTSAPELMISIEAGLSGNPGIAVGNVVGSNIANIFLVLGATAVLRPLVNTDRSLIRDSFFMIIVSGTFILFSFYDVVSRPMSILLLIMLIIYLYNVYQQEQRSSMNRTDLVAETSGKIGPFLSVLLMVIGVLSLVWGADILVDGSVVLARGFGISEAVIGLTLIAIGTSLPELAISVLAAYRGEVGVAFGSIVGSNIFNICFILGVAGLITPLEIAPQIAGFDVWVMLVASLIIFGVIKTGLSIGRFTGLLFLTAYTSYIAFLFAA